MALPRPFVTKTFTAYAGDVWLTKLAFAVWVTDQFTGKNPEAELIVRLKDDENLQPVKNPSGYYCFNKLKPAKYKVIVKPEPVKGDWYFPAEGEIDMTAGNFDPLNPVLPIELKPKPTYPFPGNATLVRATVRNSAQMPVVDAIVTVSDSDRPEQTQTNANGEFALYLKFKKKPPDKITLEIKKGITSIPVPAEIKEGETKLLGVITFPGADKPQLKGFKKIAAKNK